MTCSLTNKNDVPNTSIAPALPGPLNGTLRFLFPRHGTLMEREIDKPEQGPWKLSTREDSGCTKGYGTNE